MMKHPLRVAAALMALTGCAPPPSPDVLLASQTTRIIITSDRADAGLAQDCSAQIDRLVQRFRTQLGDGEAYGALFVGYDPQAGRCTEHAISRGMHSTVDAANLAEARCTGRTDTLACVEVAMAVPANFREDRVTISQALSAALRERYLTASGFGAVAISSTGAYGLVTGQASAEAARQGALNACNDKDALGVGPDRTDGLAPALMGDPACRIVTERSNDGTDSVAILP